ncbi:MAG TPA: peptidoglycan recognition protein [Acidimicrobiia bacterium]|nr:peptidoglycan recognition protein [Acidimicrobiia bacterium]
MGRRLLLVPAAALVLVGAPALALDQPSSSNPAPQQQQVPVAPGDQTVGAGYQKEVPVDSADLLGVKWKGDPNAQFTVEARQANGTWTTVKDVGAADTGADPGSPDARKIATHAQDATDPVSVDGASEVRVTVQSGNVSDVSLSAINADPTSAPSGSAGAFGSVLPRIDGPARYAYGIALLGVALLLVFLAVGRRPRRVSRRALRNTALVALGVVLLAGCIPPPPPPIPNGTVMPGIIPRSQWGAIPFDTANCGSPSYAPELKFAVVHHTDTPNTDTATASAARVRSIQLYHMGTLGYCDIAYNFLIDRYGQIFEGRDGGMDKPVIAAHAGGFNTGSVGVALLGTFDSVGPTTAQWNSLVHLLRWRLSVGRVNAVVGFTTTAGDFAGSRFPAGTVVSFPNAIIGHRDVDQTDCPGTSFYGMLGSLRDQVQAGIVIPPTTTSTTTSTTTTTTVAPTTTTT